MQVMLLMGVVSHKPSRVIRVLALYIDGYMPLLTFWVPLTIVGPILLKIRGIDSRLEFSKGFNGVSLETSRKGAFGEANGALSLAGGPPPWGLLGISSFHGYGAKFGAIGGIYLEGHIFRRPPFFNTGNGLVKKALGGKKIGGERAHN